MKHGYTLQEQRGENPAGAWRRCGCPKPPFRPASSLPTAAGIDLGPGKKIDPRHGDLSSPGQDRDAVAWAEHRSRGCLPAGELLVDPRTGKSHDYSYRRDVLHRALLLPASVPVWAIERALLWGSVELHERRKDAQLAREVELALPHELDQASCIELVSDRAKYQLVARGLAVDLAIHQPSPTSGGRDIHAHILISLRRLEPTGWSVMKARDLNCIEFLMELRSSWAMATNTHLARRWPERAGRPP